MLFCEEGHAVAGADMHGCVEAGVFASGTAFGWHLVVELVLDLHLVRFADLAEIQGDHWLPGLAMVNDPRGYFGEGVTDLAGEGATVEFFQNSAVSVAVDMAVSPVWPRGRWVVG